VDFDGSITARREDGPQPIAFRQMCPCPDGQEARERTNQEVALLQADADARRVARIMGEARIPPIYLGPTVEAWRHAAIRHGADEAEVDAIEAAVEEWYDLSDDGWQPGLVDADGEPVPPPQRTLLLAGQYGAGKTGLAAALAQRFLARHQTVVFRTVSEMYAELRAAPWCSSEDSQPTELAVIQALRDCQLLVLDDWGGEAITQANEQKLIELINLVIDDRLKNLKPTIYTTNLTGKVLTERVGERIMARVKPDSVSIKVVLKTPDLRGEPHGKA